MAQVGDIVGGKYRLDRQLGEGGMGTVFDAENLNTGRRVAIKVLHGEWVSRPEVTRRFMHEARATTAIAHPNIVEVFDLDTDAAQGVVYIVQELLVGDTLEAYLAAQPARRLSVTAALEVLLPVMSALVAAVSLAGLVAVIVTSLEQRRRELAVLRSIGAGPRHVLALLLLEGALLTAVGALLGALACAAAIALLSPWVQARFGLGLSLAWPTSEQLWLLGAVVLAGTAASLLPGWRAYRLSLADGLSPRGS